MGKVGIVLAALGAVGCTSSPLQPTISDRTYVPPAGEIVSSAGGDATAAATPAASTVTCTRTKGHNVYYAGSTVSLEYSCDAALTEVLLASAPAFLTASVSGKVVTIGGTAAGAASSTSWSFLVNGLDTLGDAAAIKTSVLATEPTVTLATPNIDPTTDYGTPVDVKLNTVTLDPTWDGAVTDVSLALLPGTPSGADTPAALSGQLFAATDADPLGLAYQSDCSTATGQYVCVSPTVASGTDTFDGGGEMLWKWSPFDAGSYEVRVRPVLTVEGAVMRMAVATVQFQIPQQTFGNVPLTVTGDPNASGTFEGEQYRYGFAASTAVGTAAQPVFGISYASQVGGGAPNHTFFTRASLDRTTNPLTATPTGLTQADSVDLTGADDASLSRVVALGNGGWAELSFVGGEMTFHNLADSASAPALSQTLTMSTFGGAYVLLGLDVSAPFQDQDGTTRLGVAYVMQDTFAGQTTIGLGKVNPAGTSLTGASPALDDDPDFQTTINDFEASSTFDSDKIAVVAGSVTGVPALFVAYRDGQLLMVGWVKANKSGTPSLYGFNFTELSAGLTPKPFASNAPSDQQSLGVALGTTGGKSVAAAIWRESDANAGGPRCFFRRIDGDTMDPTTLGNTIALSNGPCRLPRLAFNAASGRFVATYAEQVSGTWQIMSREVTLGTTDGANAETAVVTTGTNYPVQLEAALDQTGDFMGILYRVEGQSQVQIHGYHVSPF